MLRIWNILNEGVKLGKGKAVSFDLPIEVNSFAEARAKRLGISFSAYVEKLIERDVRRAAA